MKTCLQDASDAGARVRRRRRAERILAEDGRASGVEATVTHADGSTTALTRRGADGRRGLRRRSSRRRCCCAPASAARPSASTCACTPPRSSSASTTSRSRAGSARSSRRSRTSSRSCEDELRLPDRGHRRRARDRRRRRCPGVDGAAAQAADQPVLRYIAPFISVARDHGEGEVVLDDHGRAVVRWSLDDEVDRRLFRPRERRAGASCTTPPARRRSSPCTRDDAPLARGRGLRRLPRADRAAPLRRPTTSPASRRTRWARAAWAPTRRLGGRRPRRAARLGLLALALLVHEKDDGQDDERRRSATARSTARRRGPNPAGSGSRVANTTIRATARPPSSTRSCRATRFMGRPHCSPNAPDAVK